MPLSLLFLFLVYQVQLGNFFAFFKAQEIANVSPHLQFPPFKILLHNYYLPSAIESWKEIYIFYYVSISFMIIKLFQMKERLLGYIGLIYAIPLFFLVHADIARYSIPLLPLFFVAFHKQLGKKSMLLAMTITIPAIFAYAINLILYNVSP